ncbi:MAG: hypothetical protein PWP28_399 [Oceanotoga sp.]|uniref:hypothetical protein n=1 Tax=Oceanotoga sp. TaxID=2108366 RepID=UPI0026514900|nr:hypothetical protein [Oceanotoga sp.]MDN5341524.1 hypothetical protein [Oceanotoga sp.]
MKIDDAIKVFFESEYYNLEKTFKSIEKKRTEFIEKFPFNQKEDLVPVCPNCHMIIHSKSGQPYTIEQVKAFLKNK